MLVFRPLSTAELTDLGAGEQLTVHFAFGATPAFLAEFGLDSADDEDAERTLLYLAGLAALQRHGRRLVAVADLPAEAGHNELGVVRAKGLRLDQVSALFADEPSAASLAEAARNAITSLPLDKAWEHPAHETLLARADLLWYGPEEWARLVEA